LGTLVRGKRPMIKSTLDPVPANEWMTFRLTAQGEEASLQINGEEVWEADFIEPEFGLIGIQAENHSFEFRNVRLQEIGYIDLLEGNGARFKHLEVQSGPQEPWSLQNGVLICDGEKGGWIGTKEEFSDFILKLDFRVPQEGNSGVYIRTPQGGHGASQGMEIQIIDDDAQHWGKLAPWQLTGAIYHEFPPQLRATKKAGQWQSMLIQAVKNQVQIFVNGVPIIDADLHKNEALKDRPRSGRIGFQNYDGHIEYRNVRVKRIEE
ncbi:MAG: family 16 glycoside hydrolase, partial [Candidatus Hinthialibacter sp.]